SRSHGLEPFARPAGPPRPPPSLPPPCRRVGGPYPPEHLLPVAGRRRPAPPARSHPHRAGLWIPQRGRRLRRPGRPGPRRGPAAAAARLLPARPAERPAPLRPGRPARGPAFPDPRGGNAAGLLPDPERLAGRVEGPPRTPPPRPVPTGLLLLRRRQPRRRRPRP